MVELGVSRTQILNELQKSLHGDLKEYFPIISAACESDPEFLAHLIAWDYTNGQIKDTKVALPVITLASGKFPDELVENSLAHLALQPPRELLKALQFSIKSDLPRRRQRLLEKTIRRILTHREAEPAKWMRMAARHRRSLKSLYALTYMRCPDWVSAILCGFTVPEDKRPMAFMLRSMVNANIVNGATGAVDNQILQNDIKKLRRPMGYPVGSIFHDIANLSKMAPASAAAAIQKWHLSPLVVAGAMAGAKALQQDGAVVQAGMEQMSATELVTRAPSLEKRIKNDKVGKETFRKRVAAATTSSKATLKTGHKADEVEDDSMRTMLKELQERQIEAQKSAGRGIEGNWLIIADRSQSQEVAIELGTAVAATIAKFVTGAVWLVFCNGEATPVNATGKTLEQLQGYTKLIFANGGTSYGVGLQWAAEKQLSLDGVVIVGDGGENSLPLFAGMWQAWQKQTGKSLPVYFFQTFCPPRYALMANANPGLFEYSMSRSAIQVTKHDFTKGQVDYYSLPNVVQQLNASRFGLVERIMACPLLTLDTVLPARQKVGA